MRKGILLAILLMACLLIFAGCSCEHEWIDADCQNPKICSKCQETDSTALGHDWYAATCETPKTCSRCTATEGEPLGHTSGEWDEVTDMVTCTVSREQYCSVCNTLTGSETAPLNTLIQDDIFMFTPQEFMERLTLIAEQHSDEFTYEFVPSNVGLQVLANSNGKQSIIQFFRSNTTALVSDEIDAAEVWCVSLIALGESDADFRLYFFMVCDPTLDKDAAIDTDMYLSTAFLNATASGESFGYHQQNHLLYETTYIAEGALGQDYSMSMVNIYASDFR